LEAKSMADIVLRGITPTTDFFKYRVVYGSAGMMLSLIVRAVRDVFQMQGDRLVYAWEQHQEVKNILQMVKSPVFFTGGPVHRCPVCEREMISSSFPLDVKWYDDAPCIICMYQLSCVKEMPLEDAYFLTMEKRLVAQGIDINKMKSTRKTEKDFDRSGNRILGFLDGVHKKTTVKLLRDVQEAESGPYVIRVLSTSLLNQLSDGRGLFSPVDDPLFVLRFSRESCLHGNQCVCKVLLIPRGEHDFANSRVAVGGNVVDRISLLIDWANSRFEVQGSGKDERRFVEKKNPHPIVNKTDVRLIYEQWTYDPRMNTGEEDGVIHSMSHFGIFIHALSFAYKTPSSLRTCSLCLDVDDTDDPVYSNIGPDSCLMCCRINEVICTGSSRITYCFCCADRFLQMGHERVRLCGNCRRHHDQSEEFVNSNRIRMRCARCHEIKVSILFEKKEQQLLKPVCDSCHHSADHKGDCSGCRQLDCTLKGCALLSFCEERQLDYSIVCATKSYPCEKCGVVSGYWSYSNYLDGRTNKRRFLCDDCDSPNVMTVDNDSSVES